MQYNACEFLKELFDPPDLPPRSGPSPADLPVNWFVL
jgi:hypothetical protein